jgi:DNA gyrase subunit A
MTNGDQDFITVSRHGKALRFHERQVRPMGRTAAGVLAMRLLGDDEIVSLDVVHPDSDLLVLHERGWGKRTSLDEFREKGRRSQGNWATDHRKLDEIGPIVSARVVKPNDQVTIMTANGIVLRTAVSGISRYGRFSRGVRVVNLQEGDSVAALAVLTYEDLTREVDGGSRDDDIPGNNSSSVESMSADAELHDELVEENGLDDGDFGGDDFDGGELDEDEAALAMEGEEEE